MELEEEKSTPSWCQPASSKAVNEQGALKEEKDEGIIVSSRICFAVRWGFLRLHLQQQEAGKFQDSLQTCREYLFQTQGLCE